MKGLLCRTATMGIKIIVGISENSVKVQISLQ